jgi:hypothetical protein
MADNTYLINKFDAYMLIYENPTNAEYESLLEEGKHLVKYTCDYQISNEVRTNVDFLCSTRYLLENTFINQMNILYNMEITNITKTFIDKEEEE